ncbi:hypothetical protein ACH4UM_18620 [Streptomyces sp. NPDC020801]|uniref:hypothetical protein n=1 Tax=Streptomyces sp. NPDC020801 TaxID=3365093 RepID=UPI00379C6D89
MSARRTCLHAVYWAALALTAAVVSLVAAIPFTGPAASAAGILAAAAVSLIGLACAPTLKTRKDGRS